MTHRRPMGLVDWSVCQNVVEAKKMRLIFHSFDDSCGSSVNAIAYFFIDVENIHFAPHP